ncbi:MAG: DegT/DnrJ/EryC1/StrS family aminotransferase [Omnitrophica WOR_2 bacterium]
MTDNLPAILGGSPAFDQRVSIVRPYLPDFEDLAGGIQAILKSGMVTKGSNLSLFEQAVCEHLGVRHAVGISSCTTGLMLTYKSLGLTGEVVVPSFTFMATVSSMIWAGLKPVFADVNPDTTNLDPKAAEAAITPHTSAIVAVHNFGNPADIDGLLQVAQRHGLKLIFDAAHGFGSLYQGKAVGSQGDAQVFSLSPTKLLITGEGGLVTTNDDDLADKIRTGREYGNDGNYNSAFAGMNARLAEFNSLMGIYSLKDLESAAASRNQTAELYCRELSDLPGIGFQQVSPGNRNSYKDFSITIDSGVFGLSRDELSLALGPENIDCRKYYDPPVHRQTAYVHYYEGNPLPGTDWLAASSLSLPVWSHMPPEIPLTISRAIRRIYTNSKTIRQQLAWRD